MCGGIDHFNIADVARINGIKTIRESGGEIYAVCPFCGDKRGKFSYFINKKGKQNLYHCWSCDSGGGAVNLHIALNGGYDGEDGYNRAIIDIFQAINGNIEYKSFHNETINSLKPIENQYDKASDEHCSRVYYAMLKELPLRREHKADLLQRGLSEDEIIRYRYKSTPKDGRGVCRILIKKGYSLEGVPGFYIDDSGKWNLYPASQGYFCPAYDGEQNLIMGIQIRLDKPIGSTKYLWFSSNGKKSGASSGTVSTYLPGKYSRCILLVEGILKATIVYCFLKKEITVIGIPGTKNIASITPYLERFHNAYVYESYDMDKHYKEESLPLLYKAMDEAEKTGATLDEFLRKPENKEYGEIRRVRGIMLDSEALRKKIMDYGLNIHSLSWDMNKQGYWKGRYKGPDDFLLEYKDREKFVKYLVTKAKKTLSMQEYFAKCGA